VLATEPFVRQIFIGRGARALWRRRVPLAISFARVRSINDSRASTSPQAIVCSPILSASGVWMPTTHFDRLISTETKMSVPVD